jgi:two-component sensor histidine kinase
MRMTLAQLAGRTTLAYVVVAGAWILLSDRVLAALTADPATIHLLQTYKGGAFVAVTALLLYTTLRAQVERWNREAAGRRQAEEALRRDIAERQRAEERLRAALADNVTLLREVHHRTKNNLQMLCDLLYLQKSAMEHPEHHEDLEAACNRVYAMARLHEELYQSMRSGRVALAAYLDRLLEGYRRDYPRVSVMLDASRDGSDLDLDRALRVGLITNELVRNACRHGFGSEQPGEVRVVLRAPEHGELMTLQVRDNGSGLPLEVDVEQPKTVGLRIVRVLTLGLQARVTVENTTGCDFTIQFPKHAAAPVDPS